MDWVMEQINKGSYSVLEILENCEGVLKLFGEEGALKSVTDSMRENQPPDEEALHKLLKCSIIFRSLLKKEGLRIGYKAWQARITTDLEGCLHNELNPVEIKNYTTIHRQECAALEASGIDPFEVLDMKISFLGTPMAKPRHALSDEYKKPMDALITTVSVSNGHTPRLPWEIQAFEESAEIVEGLSSLRAPESYIKAMTSARKQVCRLLQGIGSIEKMIKTLTPHVKGILQVYPQFDLEWHWLRFHAKDVIIERAHDSILATFPEKGEAAVAFKPVLISLQVCVT